MSGAAQVKAVTRAPGARAARAPAALAVNPARHRLRGVPFLPSPNCDARPRPRDLRLVVLHAISLPPGTFGGPWIDRLFTNRIDPAAHPFFATVADLRVSAHLCVFRDGHLRQYVPFHRRAWHAGVSRFEGRASCNDFSVGIELEGTDDRPFEPVQYRRTAQAVRALLRAYPSLSEAGIVGHSDIAPGRKTDPGPCFDWIRFLAELEEASAP